MTYNGEREILFREVQHFRQPLLWLVMLALFALMMYAVIRQLVLEEPFGNNPASDTVLIVLAILLGLALVFQVRIPLLGALPGDMSVVVPGGFVYLPVSTSILISLFITVIVYAVTLFSKKKWTS